MAKGSGRINPDSAAGNARLGTGRGSNAGRSQPVDAKAFKSNVYKATSFGKTNPMIGSYKGSLPKLKPMDIYKDVTNTNFTIPIGLGLVAAAGAAGTKGLNERRKRDAIKKASVKTRKGQSRGR